MLEDCLEARFEFTGCKIALICEGQILTILRDDKETIPYPNMWDLPGGGREGNETPFECVAREVYEELNIQLSKEEVIWSEIYPGILDEHKIADSDLTLDFLLKERARELYWEGHRRTDLIRYGMFTTDKYLWQWKGGEKGGTAVNSKYNIYPIPNTELTANPNLYNENY